MSLIVRAREVDPRPASTVDERSCFQGMGVSEGRADTHRKEAEPERGLSLKSKRADLARGEGSLQGSSGRDP